METFSHVASNQLQRRLTDANQKARLDHASFQVIRLNVLRLSFEECCVVGVFLHIDGLAITFVFQEKADIRCRDQG